jgi:hypothetical protein
MQDQGSRHVKLNNNIREKKEGITAAKTVLAAETLAACANLYLYILLVPVYTSLIPPQ